MNGSEKDLTLTCVAPGCGADFQFTIGEQRFFKERFGPLAQPRRCPDCRRARRLMNQAPRSNDCQRLKM